ncbi:Alpha/Beta hydrolase protein [Biscogniauxia marginata]|nr:Alpha/Beta hydrolase protein [Biscogniauxia marginata]
MTLLFELPDKRILSYAIFGDPESGKTVFHHHGFPSSHDEASGMGHVARELGVRLIAPDRPGYGSSTYQPSRRILDWPADLLALADHLQVDRFAVLGVSGGSPYALACCHQLPKSRCVGIGILSGLYPLSLGLSGMMITNRILFAVAQWSTWLIAAVIDFKIGRIARDTDRPERLERELAATFSSRPKEDRDTWDRSPDFRQAMIGGLKGSLQAGGKAAAWEAYIYGHDWGFDIKDLKVEPGTMVMWHGTKDVNVPVTMAEKASKMIRNAELRVSKEDAHCSIMLAKEEEVVRTMSNMLG